MSKKPGFKTLTTQKCKTQVKFSIRNNLDDISSFLMDEDIVDFELYKEVTNPKSRSTKEERAALVLTQLTDVVQGNDEKYNTFMNYLRKEYSKHQVTVDMLDGVYVEKGGVIQGRKAPQPEKTPETTPAANEPAKLQPQASAGEVTQVPASFSKGLSPIEFATWMKVKNFLPEEDYSIIKDKNISGRVFVDLAETDLKGYGFVSSGLITMRSILREVTKTTPDSVTTAKPAEPSPSGQEEDDDDSVASDGSKKNSIHHLAVDRGTHMPQLKFETSEVIAELKLKQEVKVPYYERGYYTMNSNRHGVCLIINNKTFKDKTERKGTDRDEENLVETWRYMGYHVEVRRDMTFRKTVDIFCDIDDFLSGVDKKAKEKAELAHDSFVCCLLSHGNKSCIYSSDSKEVTIEYLEKAVGASKRLGGKPKVFFIQACQGEGMGTSVIETNLHVDKALQSDGGIQTSRRADIYISYATAQGDQAYRHEVKGSWYVSAVCKTLCEKSKQNTLDQLQKFINEQVAEDEDKVYVSETGKKYKQQSTANDQLKSNVHFFFGETGN